MSTDLRTFLRSDLRWHPRVKQQRLSLGEEFTERLADELPPLTPFRNEFAGGLCVIDWDHKLPSKNLTLRIFGYYSDDTLTAGERTFDERMREITRRNRYPEFDVPDFDCLFSDEAYEVEISTTGEVGKCRLVSGWRREIAADDGGRAVEITEGSDEFRRLNESTPNRPAHLGELEAVSWTPPCESEQKCWTLDVWYLLSFDGRVGTGRSFLVDIDGGNVLAVRDFSVRTG